VVIISFAANSQQASNIHFFKSKTGEMTDRRSSTDFSSSK
jgi:hypothetical protein